MENPEPILTRGALVKATRLATVLAKGVTELGLTTREQSTEIKDSLSSEQISLSYRPKLLEPSRLKILYIGSLGSK